MKRSVACLLLAAVGTAAPAAVLSVAIADKRAEGVITLAGLKAPFAFAVGRGDTRYVADMTGHRVWKIDYSALEVTVLAGTGEKGDAGDGGPGTAAKLNGPHGLAVLPNGDVLIADTWNNRVRKVDGRTGVISTYAGTGKKGFAGDGGPATKAEFGGVYCITLTPDGNVVHVADLDNRRIRAIDVGTGVVTTVAGNGKKGQPADGAVAREAPLVDPRAVAADAKGNVYVLERSGHALRVIGPDGLIRTVVGTGKAGLAGDGGEAKAAQLNGPKHLCVDRDGSVLIADTENHCIRRYLPNGGRIVRVAGTGKKGAGDRGPPESVELSQPHGVTVEGSGIFISDSSNRRVLKLVQ